MWQPDSPGQQQEREGVPCVRVTAGSVTQDAAQHHSERKAVFLVAGPSASANLRGFYAGPRERLVVEGPRGGKLDSIPARGQRAA